MRTIPVNGYSFNELSPAAQERVREWYLEGIEPELFAETCEDLLHEKFPNSDLHVEFSLSYCRGDGLNVYGNLNLFDALRLVQSDLTPEELTDLAVLLTLYSENYTIPRNTSGYAYCICDRHDYTDVLSEDIEYNDAVVPCRLLCKFNSLVQNLLTDVCFDLEERGYSYFYEVEGADLASWCEISDYEFYANGELV